MNARTLRISLRAAAHGAAGTVAALALFASGCATSPPAPSQAAVGPAVPAALPARFTEIVVPDFAETAPVPDLALGRRVADELAAGMRGVFKGTVTRGAVPSRPGMGGASTAILSGTAGLAGRAQKALLEADLPKDGPFRLEGHGLAERKVFVMTLDLALIDASTGDVLWKKPFRETRVYGYAQEAPESALADLLPVFKARIFPLLFGPPRA
ncbi:MAG TPA: hypothetical protein VMS75_04225 [Terriglobales bacterium]|nr:hypothetical protein [Terriglobales bacterium]